MDHQTLRQIEARCTQEAMPRCQAACPLRLDVRAFMERMGAGDLRGARQVLERHLPLPAILARLCDHPCEDRCLRRDLGGSLAIGGLEALCVEQTERQGRPLPRTPKTSTVAVLGAGLAGLVVAYDLSRKAWPVTIFHDGQPHEALVRSYPALPVEVARAECAALMQAGCVFRQAELTPADLDRARADFAAVFVDADAAPELFAALPTMPDAATGLVCGNLCAGGQRSLGPAGLTYASASTQAGEGRRAAATLERFMTGVSLTAERGNEMNRETPLHTPLDGISPADAVLPQAGSFTPEEGQQEAARCLRCQCLACVRVCPYLKRHGSYPRSYARQMYNNASIVKGEHLANRLINGCALCGQCTELCPERFSMAELCLAARRDMVTRQFMPLSAHEFALEDMDSASGPECALALADPAGRPTRWAFMPGCQLAASRGDEVLAVYDLLRERLLPDDGVGLLLGCCGMPAHWAGHEVRLHEHTQRLRADWVQLGQPTLIVACASCRKLLAESLPEAPLVSLWELLAHDLPECSVTSPPLTCAVHDPCAARHDAGWQQAVRSLATRAGVRLVEPAHSGSTTPCCGYGGLVWCARPEVAADMTASRADELGAAAPTALASCIMCRDRLVSQGQPCLHLVDVLPLGLTRDPGEAARRVPPGLSARRAGRAALKQRVLARFGGPEQLAQTKNQPETRLEPRLVVAPDLLAGLECRHILLDDVKGAVLAVERSGRRFREQGSGQYVGSWRPRNVTFWVRYSVEHDADGLWYRLHDAWCHRMLVPDTGC